MLDPNPTAFDVRFRLFRTPVRVHPSFWLFSAFFGWFYTQQRARLMHIEWDIAYLLLWVGCMFFSILVHEFGHILMARMFGRPGNIVLYSFGGLATGEYELPRPIQRMAVAAAGPAAGFLLYAAVVATEVFLIPAIFKNNLGFFAEHPMLASMLRSGIDMLVFMNLVWNLLNLIPIFPLDGGQIAKELICLVRPADGFRLALIFSILLALAGAAYSLMVYFKVKEDLPYPQIDPVFSAIMLGLLAFDNFTMLRQLGHDRS